MDLPFEPTCSTLRRYLGAKSLKAIFGHIDLKPDLSIFLTYTANLDYRCVDNGRHGTGHKVPYIWYKMEFKIPYAKCLYYFDLIVGEAFIIGTPLLCHVRCWVFMSLFGTIRVGFGSGRSCPQGNNTSSASNPYYSTSGCLLPLDAEPSFMKCIEN